MTKRHDIAIQHSSKRSDWRTPLEQRSLLTLTERVAHYHTTFPKYPQMWVDKGWLMGVWVLGNMYKKATPYYGAYPGNFQSRVLSLFPDRGRTLHLFSGTLLAEEGEVTVDAQCNEWVSPTIRADARKLPFTACFDFVLADPPYSASDAEKYGMKMPSRLVVLRGLHDVVSRGGHVCWLDTVRPMYSAKLWKQVGAVMVLVSTNTRTRCLSIFQKVTKELELPLNGEALPEPPVSWR
jgi:hypothetical protein